MPAPVTLLIPTHNRHPYLRRALSYYQSFKYPILILDSSKEAYDMEEISLLKYVHLPGMSLPEKLYAGFCMIETTFVVMCADDDFLITDGLDDCLRYLQSNPQYAVADGAYLFYKKHDIFKKRINFNLLYKTGLDTSFTSENALERLYDFFKEYRTVFYGVHRTQNLKDAFELCRYSYKNLYLNEYLTALLPVVSGYCKFMPVLMGIREATQESGDKTTMNLDTMFHNGEADSELSGYIECVSTAVHKKTGINFKQCKTAITNTLKNFSISICTLKAIEMTLSKTPTKKMGYFINKIPYVGLAIIKRRRMQLSNTENAVIIKSETHKRDLNKVEEKILQFQSIC